jgi:hypothetical protein
MYPSITQEIEIAEAALLIVKAKAKYATNLMQSLSEINAHEKRLARFKKLFVENLEYDI